MTLSVTDHFKTKSKIYRVDGVDVAQEMERNLVTAKYVA